MLTLFDENTENLVDYYILPLVGLSKNSFGSQYYKEGKINREGNKLYIYIEPECPVSYWDYDNYETDYINEDGIVVILFNISDKFSEDIITFVEGLYTKLSVEAKELIQQFSGLPYKQSFQNTTYSHNLLLALEPNENLIEQLRGNGVCYELGQEVLVLQNPEKLFKD